MVEETDLIVELSDQNAKCKRIAFNTLDETLVRAGMMKLGFPNGTFSVRKGKVNWEKKHQRAASVGNEQEQ